MIYIQIIGIVAFIIALLYVATVFAAVLGVGITLLVGIFLVAEYRKEEKRLKKERKK